MIAPVYAIRAMRTATEMWPHELNAKSHQTVIIANVMNVVISLLFLFFVISSYLSFIFGYRCVRKRERNSLVSIFYAHLCAVAVAVARESKSIA